MANLKDKSATIIIIDQTGTMRAVFSSVLRDLGYKNVFSLKSLKEFLTYNNKENVAWIITHSYLLESFSAFHVLRMCLEDERFRNLRVTMLLDESEEQYLPFAFAMGMLSHHIGALTPAVIREEFRAVVSSIKKEPEFSVAARFCRQYLREMNWLGDLVDLETILLEGYDHSPEQFFRTAEAYFLAGNERSGLNVLFEALMFDSTLREKANAISEKYLGRSLSNEDNQLQFDTCIIIDSDEAVRKPMMTLVKGLNFKNILEFGDGRSALEFARKYRNIDLVITEWKLRELPGPAFVQILRHELDSTIPIIVCSSLLKSDDEMLLQEIGVNKLIEKPIRPTNFLSTAIHVLKESQYPSEQLSKEREIRLHLKNDEVDKAGSIFQSLELDSSYPQGKKVLLQAELAMARGQLTSARDLGVQSAQINGYNALVLSLLGKVHIKLGEHNKALQYLEKAEALSPNNMERLCSIAVEHAAMGNSNDSKKILKELRSTAPDAQMVKEASVMSAVKGGALDEANAMVGSIDSSTSLVTFWNSQGISYVKQGKFDQGIKIYKKALLSLPPGYSDNRSFIRYNLALAYARAGKLTKSLIYLEVESAMSHSPVIKKVRSLHKKIHVSLKDNTPLVLTGSFESETIEPSKTNGLPIESNLLPGDLCLWGIYKPSQEAPADLFKDTDPKPGKKTG